MRMNKRSTEGFALAHVVIIITVLTVLSIGLMSISLRVMQVQEKNMQRLQDKYEAQGQAELFLASYPDVIDDLESGKNPDNSRILFATLDAAFEDARNTIKNSIDDYADTATIGNLHLGDYDTSGTIFTVPYSLEFVYDTDPVGDRDVFVRTTLELSCTVKFFPEQVEAGDSGEAAEGGEGSTPETVEMYRYSISDASMDFVSYEILMEGGGV